MQQSTDDDLGFVFTIAKNGDVDISHCGRHASRLRGQKASRVATQLECATFPQQQQLMARLTGNYKHGNERVSKNHSRNRR